MHFAFSDNEFVRALCWTLLHSLWQGLLLALVTGAVLVGTRKSHPQKRYAFLTILFFLFVSGSVFTFCNELYLAGQSLPPATAPAGASVAAASRIGADTVLSTVPQEQTLLQRFVDYFNANAALIVMVWFLIFIAKLVRLTANIVYVQRLRSYKVYDPPVAWKERLRMLMQKLDLRKQVLLKESGMVKVPVTMGILKPVILLPLGLLAHLPPDEIEAILLHELAHIQRKDYFVNLLQSLAETLFFFNPALLWLSSVIREERENCCDDLAIAVTNNKTNFINALISFQEYHLGKPAYGMAFPGSRHQLLNRVKRIVNARNKTLNTTEKSILGFGMALFILFSFTAARKIDPVPEPQVPQKEHKAMKAPTNVDTLHPGPKHRDIVHKPELLLADTVHHLAEDTLHEIPGHPESLHHLEEDTIPDALRFVSVQSNSDGKVHTLNMTVVTREGKEYRIRKVNDAVTELFIDGRQVPEAEIRNYRQEIDAIEKAYAQERERNRQKREHARLMRLQAMEDRKHALEMRREQLHEDRLKQMEKRRLEQQEHHEQQRMRDKMRSSLDKLQREKRKPVDKSVTYHLEGKMDMVGVYKVKDAKMDVQPNTTVPLDIKSRLNADVKPMAPMDLQLKATLPLDIKSKIDVDMKPEGTMDVKLKTDMLLSIKTRPGETLKPEGKMGLFPKVMPVPPRIKTAPRIGNKRPDAPKLFNKKPDGPPREKLEKIKVLQANDDERRRQAVSVMRSILDDLAKASIPVNGNSSWVALDDTHFIVDGRSLSSQLHEVFRAKYLKPGGMGWYLGPVQVTGRGIFLDNKDLAAG